MEKILSLLWFFYTFTTTMKTMKNLILILLVFISTSIQAQQKIIISENTTESEGIIYEKGIDSPFSGLVRHAKNDADYQLIEVRNGRIMGKIRTFYLNDKLKEEYYLNENARVEGVVYGLYESGDTIYVTDPFVDGYLTGTFRFYNAENNLELLVEVKNLDWESLPIERDIEGTIKYSRMDYSFIHGRCTTYYENGQMDEELYFENGLPHGVQKKYYENGLLWSEIATKNGKQHGISRSYNEDGTIKEEVEFIDGEQVEKPNE